MTGAVVPDGDGNFVDESVYVFDTTLLDTALTIERALIVCVQLTRIGFV